MFKFRHALAAAALLVAAIQPASAADKLTVVLDWFVNPDHAALVVAQEKGFFAEAGLDVGKSPGELQIDPRIGQIGADGDEPGDSGLSGPVQHGLQVIFCRITADEVAVGIHKHVFLPLTMLACLWSYP